MLLLRVCLVLCVARWCACAAVWSSFWAPLLEPRILNYRVQAPFEPGSGRAARAAFQAQHGHRGEGLIAALGNGNGPGDALRYDQVHGDVNFYYTYPAAHNKLQ